MTSPANPPGTPTGPWAPTVRTMGWFTPNARPAAQGTAKVPKRTPKEVYKLIEKNSGKDGKDK